MFAKARWTMIAMLLVAMVAPNLHAQLTSGSITGKVVDSVTATPLGGATVYVVHVPTGNRIEAVTAADGRFFFANLRPGGPYTVGARQIGYGARQRVNVEVMLGDATVVPIGLGKIVVELERIAVVASRGEIVEKSGPTTAVTSAKLMALPTLSRSLQDITRLSPSGNGISFGGANYRYNNLTIDGAASNDAFGFSQSSGQATSTVPTGTPGGLSRTQPISLDAVEAVTVKMAPFDVRVGGFTGASLNAVTRGGTNTTSGSLYTIGRNNSLVGSGLSGAMPSDFKEMQLGGRLGGAIVPNKVFYFVNAEISRRTDPVLYAPGSGGAQLTTAQASSVAQAFTQYAANAGYASFDAGNVTNYSIPANSSKYFGRFDFQLSPTTSLTIRDNFVDATAGNLERGAALNKFASADFNHKSRTNSLVAELKSQVGSKGANSLIFGYSNVNDRRVPYSQFGGGNQISPQVEILDGSFGQLNIGNDRESVVFHQQTRTFELSDNFAWSAGNHTITFGTHNEFYNVQYTFANSYNGRWQYPSLAAFLAEKPSRIRATYVLANNSLNYVLGTPGANFNVTSPSGYLQDEIKLTPEFTITPGVRIEATMAEAPSQTANFQNFTSVVSGTSSQPFSGYRNDYKTAFTIAPRVGFTWDPSRDRSFVVRGGAGIFQGRMPFAWFAYPFLNNGIYSANVDYKPSYTASLTKVPMIFDPTQQKTINTLYNQGNQFEINVIDNKYVQPQVARYNLATDVTLPGDWKASLEGTYTKVIKDIFFKNADDPTPAGNFGGADARPFYGASRLNGPGGTAGSTDNPFSSVFVLTNTNQGYRYSLTTSLEKALMVSATSTLDLTGAYTFGESKDVANGQRNSYQSNWEYMQVVTPNVPSLQYSNFDIRHRILGTGTFSHQWSEKNRTTATLIYTGASGSPYSVVYNSDLNNDGSSNNDVIFIPKDASQITLTTNNWSALDAYIKNDPYLDAHRGQYAQRNGPRTPWSHKWDLRIAQDLPFAVGANGKQGVQMTLDVFNFSNLVNKSWGKQYFVPNQNNQDVYSGLSLVGSRTNGVAPSFSFAPPPAGSTNWQTDDFTSRWQLQVGLRYNF